MIFYGDALGQSHLGEMDMDRPEAERLFQWKGCKARVAYLNGSRELAATPAELFQFVNLEAERQRGDLFRASISEISFTAEDIDRKCQCLKEMMWSSCPDRRPLAPLNMNLEKVRLSVSGIRTGLCWSGYNLFE